MFVYSTAHTGVCIINATQQSGRKVLTILSRTIRPAIVIGMQILPRTDGHIRFRTLRHITVLHQRAILVGTGRKVRSLQTLFVEQEAEILLNATHARIGKQRV